SKDPGGVADVAPVRASGKRGQTTSGGGEGARGTATARTAAAPAPAPSRTPQPTPAAPPTVADLIRQLASFVEAQPDPERKKIARRLRQLADKYDPRRGNGPTLEEVKEYVAEKGYDFDAEAFFHFYESNGWVQGRDGKPIKRWQSAVETWRDLK